MLFYYCRNCYVLTDIQSDWTTNLSKLICSTDSLFCCFFLSQQGAAQAVADLTVCNIWLVKWLLPQKRKGANCDCLLGWGHSLDLILHTIDFFHENLEHFSPLPQINPLSHLYFHCQTWLKSNMFPRNWQGVEGRWENNMAVKTTYCLRETRLKAAVYILWQGFQIIKYIW